MNYENWLVRLRDIAAHLASRGASVELHIGDPVSEEEMAGEEAYFSSNTSTPGFRFHESLRNLYRTARSITFRWQMNLGQDIPPAFGGMDLLPLTVLYETDPGSEVIEPWHGVWRVFDEVGAITQVVIKFSEGDGAASLAWRSIEGGTESILPLDLTLDEYLELSLSACCMHYWPLLFASDRSVLSREHKEDIFTTLGEISPPADLGVLRRAHG